MTVADNTSRNQYTATPSQALFAYTFEIVDKDDIVVLINGIPLSEGTDYTVTGVGSDTGGNIVLTSGTTGGNIVTIYRDMPYSRTQNYTNSGDFLASEVNSDFDNLWLAGEQTNRAFSQSIRKPITDSDSISMELPEATSRASKFLRFDANGAVDLAAGVTTDVDADDVSIADAGGYYTSDNVEGALQEIGAQPPGFDPNTDSFNIGSDAVSSGTDSIALGHDASATGISGISLGPNTTASGGRSISIGDSASATGGGSIALGQNASVTGGLSTALGFGATVTAPTAAIAINDATASGVGSMAIHDNSLSSGSYSIAIGYWSQATATSAMAVGYSSEATAVSSTALGNSASATSDKSIAIGFDSSASFVDAIAIGTDTRSDAVGSIAIGTGSDASQLGSVALGKGAQATGAGSTIAIGEAATTSGGLASPIAIGYQANTTGAYGVGLGYQTVTSGAQSIAIGYIASATNDNSIAIGRQLTVAGQKAVGIGWGAVAGASDSIGIGTSANASTTNCISIGASSQTLSDGGIAIGNGASISAGNIKGVAVGYAAQAQQIGGVAVGNNAICNSQFGTALGRDSNASSGSYATALGYGSVASDYGTAINNSDATGARSVAIGHSAVSSSADSIAIGYNADALGTDSIAIGNIAGADAENTIHINASGVDTNQPQTAGYIVIETDDASLKYDGSWDLTGGPLNLSGGIDVGGDVAFGDNDKAIFGAGSDLQIYHDGSHNFIEGTNAGNIYIRNALDDGDIIIQSDNGSGGVANYIQADGSNGEVRLFHYGSEKLNTTSTGIDVTGTVSADGLTVDGGITTLDSGTASPLVLERNGGTDANTLINFNQATEDWYLGANTSSQFVLTRQLNADVDKALSIDPNGDISFYEDTGTTPKFFWDASAESLGIGTSSPTKTLSVAGNLQVDSGAANSDVSFVADDGYDVYLGFGTAADRYASHIRKDLGPTKQLTISAETTLALKTNSAERLRIGSSGNVGIGTTAPAYTLDIEAGTAQARIHSTTGSAVLRLESTDTGESKIYFGDDSASAIGTIEYHHDSNYMSFDTSATERLRIDSAGNVGIGTDSPATNLEISDSSAAILRLTDSGSSAYSQIRADAGTLQLDANAGDAAVTEYISMRIAGSEAMRINSSGNLLVGKTSSAFTAAGHEIDADGLLVSTRDNGNVVVLNRETSDGSILQFRKDNLTVGSINSTGSGSTISIGGGSSGVYMGGAGVYPTNGSGTLADNSRDLGASVYRWKDLYLSGGVFLGGVAAANKLDDYEEGTWTPVLAGVTSGTYSGFTVTAAKYTKIGNTVHAMAYLTAVDISAATLSGAIKFTGLPFGTATTGIQVVNVSFANIFTYDEIDRVVSGFVTGSEVRLLKGSATNAVQDSELDNTQTSGTIMFQVTYFTAS